MRTSATQFQLLVEYMEKYGDLSKPCDGPQGRLNNAQRWNELSDLLNADAIGDTKTAEKWRKEETYTQLQSDTPSQASQPNQVSLAHEDWNQPGSSMGLPVFPSAHSASIEEPRLVCSVPPEEAHIGTDLHVNRREMSPTSIGVPQESRTIQNPTPLPSTPRRQRRGQLQNLNSPIRRRTRTQTQSDIARQAFVRSDSEWRVFQQEAERERIRVRELELSMQERWLDLFGQF